MIYIYLYTIAWFITNFEPLQTKLDLIFAKTSNKYLELIWDVLGCQKCLSLWLILFITFNPLGAMIGAMIAQLHMKLIK